MNHEQKRIAIHRKAQNVAFQYYLRRGHVPTQLQAMIAATASMEALRKFNPNWPTQLRKPRGTEDAGEWTNDGTTNPRLIPVSVQQPNPLTPSAYAPHDKNPEIPPYKRSIVRQADWVAFNAQLHLRKVHPIAQYAYRQTFAAEGGMTRHPHGSAVAGILQSTLNEIVYLAKTPQERLHAPAAALMQDIGRTNRTENLTPAKAAAVYHYLGEVLFRNIGGNAAFDKIGNAYAGAALYDTLMRHGYRAGALIVQATINNVHRTNNNPDRISVSGNLGNQTLLAYMRLAQDRRHLNLLLDELAEQRTQYLQRRHDLSQGDIDRLRHYRFLQERNGN